MEKLILQKIQEVLSEVSYLKSQMTVITSQNAKEDGTKLYDKLILQELMVLMKNRMSLEEMSATQFLKIVKIVDSRTLRKKVESGEINCVRNEDGTIPLKLKFIPLNAAEYNVKRTMNRMK
jgi:hypothetical protein